jgi:hypothetical protein
MDSVLAQYKQNQDDGELTHTQKKQRTAEQQNSQEQVKALPPADSTQTQQMLAMMEKLEGTLTKLSSRVDSIAKTQIPPQQPKQADTVDMQIEEAAGNQVQLAQNLMAKLQAASTKKDSATGVASGARRQHCTQSQNVQQTLPQPANFLIPSFEKKRLRKKWKQLSTLQRVWIGMP